ncbi:ATP-binding protein [Actinacidiphila guanduensis]|uniref:histidine kinase n=1 Tax=Actinacidiphila guanduensis TaxID=310781 RepID=A0A1G9YKY6_9ACTN|nr:ATP-binding protein [Actinacidiphila guanduensis]SDN09740.1 histidine kinase [Actinacidiphila guanduensis]
MSTHLRFAPEILIRLGEELIPHPDLGVIELVRNAYDADATKSVVQLRNATQPGGTLVVEDDGDGMTAEDIREGFLLIGRSSKPGAPDSRSNRRRIGEKGLGRLAALRLGRRVELVSRPRSEPGIEHTLVIDWSDYDSAHSVEEVELTITSQPTTKAPGTSLTVHRLRQGFDKEQMERLARAMRLLTGFFNDEDTGFTATLIAPQFDQVSDAVNRSFFDEYEYKLEAHLDEQGYASTVLYDWQGRVITQGEHIDVAPDNRGGNLQPPLRYQAPVASFELWMFLLDKRSFELRGSKNKFADLRPWLRVVGGVHLFHRGLRVHPYGDQGFDWLDLNLLRARNPQLRPSTNNSIGRVLVEDPDGLLVPKTDRMGFQENAAFIELRDFARGATEWAAKERKRIRDADRLGKPVSARRPESAPGDGRREDPAGSAGGRESFETASQPELLTLPPALPLQRQVASLRLVSPDRLLYRSLATVGILAVACAHEVATGREAGETGLWAAELTEIAARATRPDSLRVEVLDLNRTVGEALSVVRPQLERRGIILNEEFWDEPISVAGSVSDLESIVFNLVANAMSAFARAGDLLGERAMLVRTRVDDGRALVDFSDAGPGIVDVDIVEMWRPGVTGGGGGAANAGLGLTVVRDAVADLCGTRSVVDEGALSADPYGELGGASFHIRLPLWSSGE